MRTRILGLAVALCLCSVVALYADENVRDVQTKLRDGGFYSGEIDGAYSSELAAGLTRYQVRNGLPVTGQLDVETSKSLGAKPAVTTNEKNPEQEAETWRQLRKSRQRSPAKSTSETTASARDTTENGSESRSTPPKSTAATVVSRPNSENASSTASVKRSTEETTVPRHANQDRPDTTSSEKRSITETTASSDADEEGSETTSIKTSRPVRTAAASETIAETQLIDSSPGANNVAGTTRVGPARPSAPKVGTQAAADTAKIQVSVPGSDGFSVANIDTQRIRDYVAAFVLAGLDPHVASEADFFADRVRYYDAGIKDRDAIRRDLQSYNRRWPHRTFWLPGEIKIEPQSDNQVRVTFPLRFELQNGETKSRGQVEKDIVLRPAGDDFEIVAVNEREVN